MFPKMRKQRGFTLVELMIVVAIVGILAALAIYGVNKYVANAKTAEARNSIGQMSKDAVTAYVREGMSASVMSLGATTGISHRLCDGSTAVPTALASVGAKKYQSKPSDWKGATSGQFDGWNCVKFSMNDPQYYQYQYTSSSPTTASGKFFCTATGDLDGDTKPSTFTINGGVATDGGKLVAIVGPSIVETDPEE